MNKWLKNEMKEKLKYFLTVKLFLYQEARQRATAQQKKGSVYLKSLSLFQRNSQMIITATKNQIELVSELNINLLTEPDVLITGFDYPDELYYDEEFDLSFVLSSDALIKDIVLEINGLQPIEIEKTKKAESIVIKTNSKHFWNNKIDLTLRYKDEYDREFKLKKEFQLDIQNFPWYIKMLGFLQNLI